MNTTKATFDALSGLTLTIDGLQFDVGDKLTVLNAGFAVLMAKDQEGKAWLAQNTGGLPAGPNWDALSGPGFTDDPVVVALALRAWHWTVDQPLDAVLDVPTTEAAKAELAARKVPSLDGVPLIMEDGRFVPLP